MSAHQTLQTSQASPRSHSMVESRSHGSTISIRDAPTPFPRGHADKSHHGNDERGKNRETRIFCNPWPSYRRIDRKSAFKTRFGAHPEKNFVAVPKNPDGSRSSELVRVRKPDWGMAKFAIAGNDARVDVIGDGDGDGNASVSGSTTVNGSTAMDGNGNVDAGANSKAAGNDSLRGKIGLKATWLGHASFLVELPANDSTPPLASTITASQAGRDSSDEKTRVDTDAQAKRRGVRVLFDPVWSERTSPFSFIGPKRYSPVPCDLSDLPDVDVVCISHNHYDHLDFYTMKQVFARRKSNVVFCVPLGVGEWFTKHVGVAKSHVVEFDWWERRCVEVQDVGWVQITSTPAQHGSGRTPFDQDHTLWCGWVLESARPSSTGDLATATTTTMATVTATATADNLDPSAVNEQQQARTDERSSTVMTKVYFAGDTAYQAVGTPSACPAFDQIGQTLGPFDLGLLPIGLCTPASFMGSVHATPEQSLEIHKTVGARISLGMHYGTVRGGISAHFEDVRDPPRRWRVVAEREGLWNGGGVEGNGKAIETGRSGVGLCDIGETVVL